MYKANSQLYVPLIKDVPEKTWAYLAGLIDGEGSILIAYNSSDSKRQYKDGWRRTYNITITNNSFELLNEVQKRINIGKVYGPYYYKGHSHKDEYRLFTCYLGFNVNSIRAILPKIIPHLILKKELAEIMQRSLQIGEEIHIRDERRTKLKELDIEYRLAFLRTKGNKPYTNNKEYWQKKRAEKGRPPIIGILD